MSYLAVEWSANEAQLYRAKIYSAVALGQASDFSGVGYTITGVLVALGGVWIIAYQIRTKLLVCLHVGVVQPGRFSYTEFNRHDQQKKCQELQADMHKL